MSKKTEKTTKPIISIIVPTFDRSNLLNRALDSIYNQTWKEFEIVVVDDNIPNSPEEKETLQVLERYRQKGQLLYLKTEGKTGGGAARNYAIQQCHGEYVAFLDDDDCYLPDKLEKQIQFMLENDLDGSYQDVMWFSSKEKLVEYRSLDVAKDFSREELLKAHILHSLCPTSVYMFKRDKVLQTEGFGEVSSGQDFILMLRFIDKGFKIAYMPGAYVKQYLHEGERISVGLSKINGENHLYELKHDYFHMLTKAEQRYVDFRHYAVLSFASMRDGKMIQACRYAVKTIVVSPGDCVKASIRYFGSKMRRV